MTQVIWSSARNKSIVGIPSFQRCWLVEHENKWVPGKNEGQQLNSSLHFSGELISLLLWPQTIWHRRTAGFITWTLLIALDSRGHWILTYLEKSCSLEVQHILIHARKESIHKCHDLKWKRFLVWATKNIASTMAPIESLFSLKLSGLSQLSVKVHLVAISAYHSLTENKSVFTHDTVKSFLKGQSTSIHQSKI